MKTANQLRQTEDSGSYIYRKGNLSAASHDKHERIGLWDSMDGSNYAACVSCGTINHFDHTIGIRVHFDRRKLYGDVSSCVVCFRCQCHFFITLEDWPASLTEDQKKMLRIVRRGLGAHLRIGFFDTRPEYVNAYMPHIAFVRTDRGWQASVVRERGGDYFITLHGMNIPREPFDNWEPAVRKMVEMVM